MYLFLFIAVCIIIAFNFKILFGMNFENSIGVSQLGIIVILYLFYILDILSFGIILIWTALIACLVGGLIFSIRKKNIFSTFKAILREPFWAYVIFLFITFFIVNQNAVTRADDLCYWAALPKILFQYNGEFQSNGGFQTYCVDYVPAMPLYMFFLEKLNGNFNDGVLFFGYAALTGALLLPAGKNISGAFGTLSLAAILWIVPLFFYNTSTNDSAIFYNSLYVDPVLGIAAGCLVWLFLQAPWETMSKWIQFTLYACFVILIKSSGVAFVFVTMLLTSIYLALFQKKFKKKCSIGIGVIFPFFLYLIWQLEMKYFGIKDTIDYKLSSMIDLSFIKTFLAALVKESLLTSYITCFSKYYTFIVLFLLLSIIMVFLLRLQIKESGYDCCKRGTDKSLIKYSYTMIWIICAVYVIGLYALCVGSWNSQLFSFKRYICTILEMLICFITCNVLYDFNKIKDIFKHNGKYKLAGSVLIICVTMIFPIPVNTIKATYSVFPNYVYKDYENLYNTLINAEISSKEKWSRIILVVDEKEPYVFWIKSFYKYMKDHLSYSLIPFDIQISHNIYYTSQFTTISDGDNVVCNLAEANVWNSSDYILWCHGNYPDNPILKWELYRVESIEADEMILTLLLEESRNILD